MLSLSTYWRGLGPGGSETEGRRGGEESGRSRGSRAQEGLTTFMQLTRRFLAWTS